MTDAPDPETDTTPPAKPAGVGQKTRAALRDDRRAAALKANMARRKEQTRARAAEPGSKDE